MHLLSFSLSVNLSVCESDCLSARSSFYLSFCLCLYPSLSLFICLCICVHIGYVNTVMTSQRHLTPEFVLGANGKI